MPESLSIRIGDVDEIDRRTIIANGIVVDVTANDDGSVYVETYAYAGRAAGQVIVQHAAIDRYKTPSPNLRLEIAQPNASTKAY